MGKSKIKIASYNKQKQVKKNVTLRIEWIKNEKGNFKQKKTWIHEVIDDVKKT